MSGGVGHRFEVSTNHVSPQLEEALESGCIVLPEPADGQAAHDADRQPQQVVRDVLRNAGFDESVPPVFFDGQPRGGRDLSDLVVAVPESALDGQVDGDQEQLAEEELLTVFQEGLDCLVDGRTSACRPAVRLLAGALEDVFDDRDDQVVLGRKMMGLRAA